jgi:type 1 glutamine amidotransferase
MQLCIWSRTFFVALFACSVALSGSAADDPWVVYPGGEGPGRGKHIVLVSGDEEYRSEESLPMLGKILATHHGFKCTVLFAVDQETGLIDPDNQNNIPGLHHLASADLMIIHIRFRDLPEGQMRHIAEYVDSGRPIIGIRAAVAAFRIPDTSKTYARYGFRSKIENWEGGFGQQILGMTWIRHHGRHGQESTRGVIVPGMESDPIVHGCEDIWGPTDVYATPQPLPGDSQALVLGQVLEGMKPDDKPVAGKKNDPCMPIAWTKTYRGGSGRIGRVFTSTIGAATDFESEGLRRLLVNASYWCLDLEDQIPPRADVRTVGEYLATPFGFGKYKRGVRPADHALPSGP